MQDLECTQTLKQNLPLSLQLPSLPAKRKYEQQTDKLIFPTHPQKNGKRCFVPQEQNFYLSDCRTWQSTMCPPCVTSPETHAQQCTAFQLPELN